MSRQRSLVALTIVAFLVLASSISAFGQAVYGSIIGTVTDPQGAAVSGAKVTVTNVRKGTVDTATTNESGNYSVTHLVPDSYNIKVEGQGFKVVQQNDIRVSADTSIRVDSQFQLGSAGETVEVTAEAQQLKTDRADVATQFNERYVESLPVLNRNFIARLRIADVLEAVADLAGNVTVRTLGTYPTSRTADVNDAITSFDP